MKFDKYHALGNDYIVLDPYELGKRPSPNEIHAICAPHFGVGADGVLFGPLIPKVSSKLAQFRVKIFNPDGSEAEKSGNGLRIFTRHLKEKNMLSDDEETGIETLGGIVRAVAISGGRMVQVDMGKVSFLTMDQQITAGDRTFTYYEANIGNPHCVIILPEVTPELARQYGPLIENNPIFPKRTNVQFMKVLDRNNIQLEIWERGAEYTLASGSSSSAAGAVARRLGLCDADIISHMPGGNLLLCVSENYSVRQTGPVVKVMSGIISKEIFEAKI